MTSPKPGSDTSAVEVTNISAHGIWLLVGDKEYWLPFDKFPWFKEARVSQIGEVQFLHGYHLHWPKLDVDLELSVAGTSRPVPSGVFARIVGPEQEKSVPLFSLGPRKGGRIKDRANKRGQNNSLSIVGCVGAEK